MRRLLISEGLKPAARRSGPSWGAFIRQGRECAGVRLLHRRDAHFAPLEGGSELAEVFRSEAIKVIHTPIRAPRANAYAERFVRTVRVECLDWLLILGRRHLERVLRTYAAHYNAERPHRSLFLIPPDGSEKCKPAVVDTIERRDLLGGLIHEYRAAA